MHLDLRNILCKIAVKILLIMCTTTKCLENLWNNDIVGIGIKLYPNINRWDKKGDFVFGKGILSIHKPFCNLANITNHLYDSIAFSIMKNWAKKLVHISNQRAVWNVPHHTSCHTHAVYKRILSNEKIVGLILGHKKFLFHPDWFNLICNDT